MRYACICIHIHEIPKVIKVIETEHRKVAAQGWREGKAELAFNGCRVCRMKNFYRSLAQQREYI